MSKTLNNILTVFKVVRIIAKVVFILCIIGGVGSLLGFLCLPVVGGLVPEEILLEEGVNLSSAYLACIVGVITCAGEAVFAFLAEKYFKSVLDAQTPFTETGAKECFRLGIASLIISVATSIVAGIASAIVLLIESEGASLDVNTSFSLFAKKRIMNKYQFIIFKIYLTTDGIRIFIVAYLGFKMKFVDKAQLFWHYNSSFVVCTIPFLRKVKRP